ncbi:hypothetical protein GCM10011581_12390 [Saccharopolyspora subtropica]|uniref:Putative T7SS secretion signal domain-containing protein n=1 Tax=Saccharopolyspora thermophila TaxID=89367 RepID=A0A917NA39_9PSEU|nr:hypothetical protein [Saccharopolyspora subtropica]GGI76798.1 hypothetical protein GCM10011581_12390 [Saccharopolyspora subtropica]
MTPELGTTNDPKALVPGDPDAVRATSAAMISYGDALHEAGDGLKRINTAEGWDGQAADQFRDAFDGEPTRWLEAGDAFHHAAGALDHYSGTLTWAQNEAASAIRLWNEGEAATRAAQVEHARAVDQAQQQAPPGAPVTLPFHDPGEAKRQAARDMLARARRQLAAAGEQAADVVGRARDKAPEKSWLGQALDTTGDAAGTAVNAVASFGNAAVQHPELLAGLVGGAALTAVSSIGMAGGVALDATGAGALAGGPLTYASGAGIVTGAGIIGSAAMALGAEAAGDDEVEVIDTTDEPPAPALPWEDPVVQEKLPDEWGEGRPNNKGVGHRWQDPTNEGNGVRIDQGNPNNSQPTQQVDHVIVRDNGKVIGRDGQPIPGAIRDYPEQSHIPLSEWKTWKQWNHP